jgi:hypothetical protein
MSEETALVARERVFGYPKSDKPAPPAKLDSNKPTPYTDRLENEYLEGIGEGRELREALMLSKSKRSREFLEALLDPKNKNKTIQQLAKRHNFSLIDLIQVMREFWMDRGIEVYQRNLPKIAADIARDAQSINVTCGRCDGTGLVKGNTCKDCHGTGEKRKAGDTEARKLIHEAVGITKKAPMVQLNQQINTNFPTVDSVLDSLERPVIDVEPI